MTDKLLISFKNICKKFGSKVIYEDLNLDVYDGQLLCLFGESGTGKTVMLKMLVGLLPSDSGEIWFKNSDLTKLKNDNQWLPVRKRIAMVFQGSALFDSMTIFENIAYPLKEHFQMTEDEIEHQVNEKLSWVGLEHAKNLLPGDLSGGMKKRVGLARSIAINPEVILYDEPTAGLDPVTKARIIELILSLKQRLKSTGIIVTHDLDVAKLLADECAFVAEGKIIEKGNFKNLQKSQNKTVRSFFESIKIKM